MTDRLKNWILPSIADVLFLSVLFYLALPMGSDFLGDGDTGYHIRVGDYILTTLSIPREDIFSFITPTIPWTAHEWLAEVIMSLLHTVGGLTAVVFGFALMVAVSVRIFFRGITSEGNNILSSVAASIVFVTLAKVHWLARPHIFSLVILLVWCRLLDDYQYRQKNRLWLLPLIMILWVNLHGGYIIGLAIMGIYCAGNVQLLFTDKARWVTDGREKAWVLGRSLALSIAACLVNPTGYHIFLFPLKLVSNKYIMDHTSEFLSPNFHEPQPLKYILLLLFVVFAYAKRKPTFIETALTLLFTSMSLYSVRYIPLYGVVVMPIIMRYIERDCLSSFPKLEGFLRTRVENIASVDTMAQGYLWPVAGVVFLAVLALNGTVTHSFDPEKKPMAALKFLRDHHVTGNMFNNDEFGDCVIYALTQQYKVFIDGRLDMYGSERVKEYCRVTDLEPGWETTLDKYNITWIFFDTNSILTRVLTMSGNWKLIYSDKVASIFVKNIPKHQELIQKFSNIKLFTGNTPALSL